MNVGIKKCLFNRYIMPHFNFALKQGFFMKKKINGKNADIYFGTDMVLIQNSRSLVADGNDLNEAISTPGRHGTCTCRQQS